MFCLSECFVVLKWSLKVYRGIGIALMSSTELRCFIISELAMDGPKQSGCPAGNDRPG